MVLKIKFKKYLRENYNISLSEFKELDVKERKIISERFDRYNTCMNRISQQNQELIRYPDKDKYKKPKNFHWYEFNQ